MCTNKSGTWPPYLTDPLSLKLVGAVGARINVRSLFSQRGARGGLASNAGSMTVGPELLIAL